MRRWKNTVSSFGSPKFISEGFEAVSPAQQHAEFASCCPASASSDLASAASSSASFFAASFRFPSADCSSFALSAGRTPAFFALAESLAAAERTIRFAQGKTGGVLLTEAEQRQAEQEAKFLLRSQASSAKKAAQAEKASKRTERAREKREKAADAAADRAWRADGGEVLDVAADVASAAANNGKQNKPKGRNG